MPPKEAAPEAEAGRVLAAERLRHTVMPQVVMEPILAMLTVPLLVRHMADTVQVAMVVVVTVDVVAAEEEDIMVVNQKVNWRLPALLLFLGKVFIMNSISFLKVCI